MAKQEKSVHRKSRGRPAGRLYVETIPVRLTPDLSQRIDEWAKANGEDSRSETMRRLLELGLGAAPPKRSRSK
jgi:metal-responsive CopG/Arc/MetJ family transcriptional regulator